MKMYFIIIWYQKQGNDNIHDGDKGIGVKAIVFIMIWLPYHHDDHIMVSSSGITIWHHMITMRMMMTTLVVEIEI